MLLLQVLYPFFVSNTYKPSLFLVNLIHFPPSIFTRISFSLAVSMIILCILAMLEKLRMLVIKSELNYTRMSWYIPILFAFSSSLFVISWRGLEVVPIYLSSSKLRKTGIDNPILSTICKSKSILFSIYFVIRQIAWK